MPRNFRLKRSDFEKTRGFKRYNSEYFGISYGRIAERSSPGGGCVVSSKNIPNAVDRNRIKRRCRAILSDYLRKQKPGNVVVVYPKAKARGLTSAETKRSMVSILSHCEF